MDNNLMFMVIMRSVVILFMNNVEFSNFDLKFLLCFVYVQLVINKDIVNDVERDNSVC